MLRVAQNNALRQLTCFVRENKIDGTGALQT